MEILNRVYVLAVILRGLYVHTFNITVNREDRDVLLVNRSTCKTLKASWNKESCLCPKNKRTFHLMDGKYGCLEKDTIVTDCNTANEVKLLSKNSETDSFWKSEATVAKNLVRNGAKSHNTCKNAAIWIDNLESKSLKVNVEYETNHGKIIFYIHQIIHNDKIYESRFNDIEGSVIKLVSSCIQANDTCVLLKAKGEHTYRIPTKPSKQTSTTASPTTTSSAKTSTTTSSTTPSTTTPSTTTLSTTASSTTASSTTTSPTTASSTTTSSTTASSTTTTPTTPSTATSSTTASSTTTSSTTTSYKTASPKPKTLSITTTTDKTTPSRMTSSRTTLLVFTNSLETNEASKTETNIIIGIVSSTVIILILIITFIFRLKCKRRNKSPTCIMNATYDDVNLPVNTPHENNDSTPEYAYCEALKTNIPASVVDQSGGMENTYTCIELEKKTDEEYTQLSIPENAITSLDNPANEPLYFQTESEHTKTEPECFEAEPSYVEIEPENTITEPEYETVYKK